MYFYMYRYISFSDMQFNILHLKNVTEFPRYINVSNAVHSIVSKFE